MKYKFIGQTSLVLTPGEVYDIIVKNGNYHIVLDEQEIYVCDIKNKVYFDSRFEKVGGCMYKIGDKVRCIDPGCEANDITLGNIYEVVQSRDYDINDMITIVDDKGISCEYFANRFELVTSEVATKQKEVSICKCSSRELFNFGCKCGAFQKEV